jgi:hypothetical protein
MGYDLHITRKDNWADDDSSNNITIDQWLGYVKNDPEMRLDNFAEASTTDGQRVRIEEDGICVWTKYSKDGIGGNRAWFWLSHGNIDVKNPDPEIRNKMIDIANYLKAKVQGDDGEPYEIKEIINTRKPWWKLW